MGDVGSILLPTEEQVGPPRRFWQELWDTLGRRPGTLVGIGLILSVAALAFSAPMIAPFPPEQLNAEQADLAPSATHFFGTDSYGFDIFSRVVWAARLDLVISIAAVTLSMVLGIVLGGLAGWQGGLWDEALMRLMDIFQAFPSLIFAMGIAFGLGPGLLTVIAATSVIDVPSYVRLMRNLIHSAKRSQYALAALMIGCRPMRVLFRYLVPNCMGPVLAQGTLHAGWAILGAAGLSFIGLGVPLPRAEWGVMIAMGLKEFLVGHWWTYTFPGIAVFVTVLGFHLMGDGLQDILDPRRR